MKLKATIVALVLGTSSIAMARPATVHGSADVTVTGQASLSIGTRAGRPPVQNRPRRVVRPVYNPPPVYEPAPSPTPSPQPVQENIWVEEGPTYMMLRSGNSITGTRYNIDHGVVGQHAFKRLRLEARGSVTSITEVRVTYWSGWTQTIPVHATLAGDEVITLKLNGQENVSRVLVYGKSMDGGQSDGFAILAR